MHLDWIAGLLLFHSAGVDSPVYIRADAKTTSFTTFFAKARIVRRNLGPNRLVDGGQGSSRNGTNSNIHLPFFTKKDT